MYGALESKENKVFLMSAPEMKDEDRFKDNAARKATFPGETSGQEYWLRSIITSTSRPTCVGNNGYVGTAAVQQEKYMRPALYLDLNQDACVQRVENEGKVTWEYDAEHPEHAYANPKYSWTEDLSACTAIASCEKCGLELREEGAVFTEVTQEPSVEEEGNTRYTATFEDDIFETQIKDISIDKLPAPEPEPKPEPTPEPKPEPKPEKPVKKTLKTGVTYKVAGATFKVISAKKQIVSLVKAKNAKTVNVPTSVKIYGKTCKVIRVNAKAFTGSKIRKVYVGKNVTKMDKYAFAKSKATSVVLKAKQLKKSTVTGCFKSSKVKTVQVKVGSKAQNKKMVKTYKKIFTSKNCGKKVVVK